MALILKVGSFDLSSYVRVAHEDGLDPANPEHSEPQFTGSLALSEGKSFVGDAVNNRMESFPLILDAEDTDGLYALVREIEAELTKGAQVEFRSGGAGSSTFFDLESGRLEQQFEFWLDQAARLRAMLHLWVRPRGHTGTMRLLASSVVTGAAVLSLSDIRGDADAQVNLEARLPSSTIWVGNDVVLMYGLKYPAASGWNPIISPSALKPFSGKATVIGASGRFASAYRAFAVTPTAIGDITIVATMRPQDAGRYRVFMPLRHQLSVPTSSPTPPNMFFTQQGVHSNDQKTLNTKTIGTTGNQNEWQMMDWGEVTLTGAAEKLHFQFNGASGASAVATYPLQVNNLILLPIDQMVGIYRQHPSTRFPQGDSYQFSFNAASRSVEIRTSTGFSAPSAFLSDEIARLRGDLPRLPPVPSSAPSGAAQLLTVLTTIEDGLGDAAHGNLQLTTRVHVRERFRYFR